MDETLISEQVFSRFCRLIYEQAGIHLTSRKRSLVSARLSKRMRALGVTDFSHYYRLVRDDPTQDELIQLLDAVSTNVTHFFREHRHFDVLAELLTNWEQQGRSRIRIWSAACSTGEEPYSAAMTAMSAMHNTHDVKILATDISTRVLNAARIGEYPARRLQDVPRTFVTRFFEKRGRGDGAFYRIRPEVRRMVTVNRLNLAAPPFPMKGPLDVVLCRNVMIYFDNSVRRRLLNQIDGLLRPGGYLMVGHAESLSGMLSDFRAIEPSIYIKE
jgi:chemotaxis protein methyltransferase CheR